MKTKLLITSLLLYSFITYSQEDLKTKTHITGYVNTLLEYSDLDNGFEDSKDPGIGLSEAAFLVSHKPIEKLELKGTFVYTHAMRDVQALFVEAYGIYTLHDALRVGAGKFLTPLSPVNQYFYAPSNVAATLPMLVSHHIMLPQSMTGFQISGEYGKMLKVGYNGTLGLRGSYAAPEMGMIGLQGREGYAALIWRETYKPPTEYRPAWTARTFVNYNDIFNLGFNYYHSSKAGLPYQLLDLTTGELTISTEDSKLMSYGVDLQVNYRDLKFSSEFWHGDIATTDLDKQISIPLKGYYGELSYQVGTITPFVRYDYSNDQMGSLFLSFPDTKLFDSRFAVSAISGGINYRPIYEIMLKLEYRYLDVSVTHPDMSIPEALEPVLPPDNPFGITVENYNHFVLSLVYSF